MLIEGVVGLEEGSEKAFVFMMAEEIGFRVRDKGWGKAVGVVIPVIANFTEKGGSSDC